MKISIDIDCSPEEARRFFGLPDLAPLQEAVMQRAEARLTDYLDKLEPEELMQAWLPSGLKGFEALQKAFFAQWGGKPGPDA